MTDTATPATEAPAAPVNPTPDRLKRALGDDLLQVIEDRGELTCVVRRERILETLGFLKSQPDLAYIHCSDVTAVDYLDLSIEPRFAVVYHLYSFQHNRRLRLRAPLPAEDPAIDSCVDIFPTANWFEREVFDLMGVDFRGHPDLKRILLPDGWEGAPPLRKDTPIGGEDVEFTYNVGRVHGRRSEI